MRAIGKEGPAELVGTWLNSLVAGHDAQQSVAAILVDGVHVGAG